MQMQMQPPNENRQQKRHSVEKRMSLEAKRSSLDKRASLEIKLHDGMIVVDEEERNRLLRKTNAGGTNGGVINHPQVHNHFQSPPPRSVSSPTGGFAPVGSPGLPQPQYAQQPQFSQRPPTQPGPQPQFIPQGGYVHPNQRPPFNPQQGPTPGMAFQGPPRQGSLTSPSQFSPPQFQQQLQRPPPPMQQQQQQFSPSMMNMPPPSPQGFPGSGAPLQQSQPMMPGGRPMYSGSVRPPLGSQQPPQVPNQFGPPSLGLPNIGRHSPMMLDLQSQTWDSSKVGPDTITPATLPGPSNNAIPIGSTGPQQPPQPVPAAASTGIKTPATIQEEEQFSEVEEDDEYYDDDNESAGSFLSFDEETEDNTEYNAIVDYDLLDMIMGGSTDYDAPMPRATHERRVVFNQLVKAQSLVRVLKDGEALSPIGNGGDPDGDTEFEESESEIEEDDYDQESEEEEVYDESPPSPILQVVNMLPLRPADLEGQEVSEVAAPPPEITPRGVSLKMNPDGTIAAESSSPPKVASALLVNVPQGVHVELGNVATPPSLAPVVTTATSAATGTETSPITTSANASSVPRKKVRHVQIQTRGATMKTQQTMTDLTMATTDTDFSDEFNEFPSGAVVSKAQPASATVDSSTASTAGRDDPEPPLPDPRIADLESERDFLQSQNHALQETITRLQEEANARQVEREEAQAKFDKLSGQAMRKIKELVAERQVLEVEMEGLKGQVRSNFIVTNTAIPKNIEQLEIVEEKNPKPVLTTVEFVLVFVGLAFAVFLTALDQTIVVVALQAIAEEFSSLDQINWIATA
ncbi:UNVERIFIED_CONTAM: hypothetical protein HDU68_011819 [Siphonaria sp. JEL0065]|nr:hypothetical protein HDU68_011819 [Siphonaria sp. JEL0065]